MKNKMGRPYALVKSLLAAAWFGSTVTQVGAAVDIIGVQYQQDELFPEFNCIWHDKDYPTSCSGTYLGGNLHVYLKNTGASSITFTDATLAGYNLNTVLKENVTQSNARSVHYYWLTPPADITAAGVPVWWKGDPSSIPAGGVGQAIIRLRFPPTTTTVAVGVQTTGGNVSTNIPIEATPPQLASVGFSQDRTKVYLHWRRAGGAGPTTIKMDGNDVTGITSTVNDPALNFAESVINLASPLTYMSYHVFQGVYADGKTATASLRAWSHEFIHASWGVFPVADGDLAGGKAFVDASLDRGLNAIQNQAGGGVTDYLQTGAGKAYAASRGYGMIVWNKYSSDNPLLSFLEDEVDGVEDRISKNYCSDDPTKYLLPCGASPMGILAMREIAEGEDYRATYPNTPTTINMAATFKPENYYAWGQAVDVLQSDPYYQKRLKDTYWFNPERIPLYKKAYPYIYAIVKGATRAAEPNPYHVILQSTESRETVNGVDTTWPFATPQAKRTEAYYALAAGTKGMSYWWFKPCGGNCSNGLGDQSKQAARDVWKEMGLYGNEIKTVSHLLVASHPVDWPLTPSTNVWARALAVGTNTLMLLIVNDNHYNDVAGFHSTDVPNATITATLPAWMQTSLNAFEVSAGGLSDASAVVNGSQLQVNLGTLKLTRMIILTKDAQLRSTLQQRYDVEVRPGVCNIAPELCASSPPSIAQSPANQSVISGGTVNFNVLASGSSPLSYRWQKNSFNLSDGGHYSGAGTATLTISGADSGDVASYRCMVTNLYGTNYSTPAMLTVTNSSNPPIILTEPANQNVIPGGTCSFTVTATGANPLKYQWQKNNADLSNGGHYSGCTTNRLTITAADYNDVASYRCMVTNSFGVDTSIEATLSVSPGCLPVSLVNGSFEGTTNVDGVATGWIGYQRAPAPTSVWTIQSANPPAGSGQRYQQIANTTSTGGGGVRQDIYGCVVGATYRISGWMRGNSQLYSTCTVKVSPSASTDWSTASNLNPPQTVTGDYWTNFSGTVIATGASMTLWLDGQTGGTGQNKAACFDSVSVACVSPLPPLQFTTTELIAENQLRLGLIGPAGSNVTVRSSSNLVDWMVVTNLVNAGGAVEFIDASGTAAPQRFYRASSP